MTKDELKLALKHAKRDERHLSNAETRYWCNQYKLLATQAVEALEQPEPWEKFCDSNCVWTDHHPNCKLAEQEPVVWAKFSEKGNIIDLLSEPDDDYAPLYTTPPQRTWVGLTLDERIELAQDVDWAIGAYCEYAEKIEAKLRSKNESKN